MDRDHGGQRQGAIEMGEQLAAARRLPTQGVTQTGSLDGQQQKAALSSPVTGGRLFDLGGGGEMDEAVGLILGGAPIESNVLGSPPFLGPAHMINCPAHLADPTRKRLELTEAAIPWLGFPGKFLLNATVICFLQVIVTRKNNGYLHFATESRL
jgi:hypothetical protein